MHRINHYNGDHPPLWQPFWAEVLPPAVSIQGSLSRDVVPMADMYTEHLWEGGEFMSEHMGMNIAIKAQDTPGVVIQAVPRPSDHRDHFVDK